MERLRVIEFQTVYDNGGAPAKPPPCFHIDFEPSTLGGAVASAATMAPLSMMAVHS